MPTDLVTMPPVKPGCLGYCTGRNPCPIPEHCRCAHLPDDDSADDVDSISSTLAAGLLAAGVVVMLALVGAGALVAHFAQVIGS